MLKALIQLFIKQTGRKPNAIELLKLKFKAANQSGKGKVIEFPKDRITPFYKPRPGEGVANTKQRILKIDDELEKLSAKEGKYANMSRNERDDLMIQLQDESSTLQGKPKVAKSPKGNINYSVIEEKFGFPLQGNESLSELAKIEKMGRDEYYNSLANRAMSIRTRMARSDAEGGTEIAYQEFNKLQKELDGLNEFITRVQKEIPEGMASGGMARVGMAIGGFTKLEVLIQILKNTIKGSKDSYVTKTFPKWIKELQKNPKLALDENVWKELTGGLPKNQKLVVHSDDSVDFFTQSKFGPHNIEKTLEFQKKHNLSRDQANKILRMDPEDRVLEMKRIETIRNKTKPVVASSDEYVESLDKKIMEEMDITKSEMDNMSSTALDDLRRNADPMGMQKHFDEITEGRGVGDFAEDSSFLRDEKQTEILDKFDVTGRKKNASGGIAGQLHLNEGGRVPMIFGGSAGLKAKIALLKAGLNKGRTEKIKTLFPTYSAAEKEILRLGEKYLPKDKATYAAQEAADKAEGVQVLIDSLKHDKKLIAEQAKNKAKNDPSLDFLMESLEKTMPEAYGPHLKKYTNIDKDILQLETIKKNLIMKDRKLNAEGGRASLSNGGLANILGV